MLTSSNILRVAVASPLRNYFDYVAIKHANSKILSPGVRLHVPFGAQRVYGVLVEITDKSNFPVERLKSISHVLDEKPLLSPEILKLLAWTCAYYHHSPGEVYMTAFPVLLRKGGVAELTKQSYWCITDLGQAVDLDTLKRSPRQIQLLDLLKKRATGISAAEITSIQSPWRPTMDRLAEKGWVNETKLLRSDLPRTNQQSEAVPVLNDAQQQAVDQVNTALGQFQAFVLHGVTGSGKTEVYMNIVAAVLARNQSALILVPEIGLTPQIVRRFERRFSVPIAVLHSGMNDKERLNAWLLAQTGRAKIVIGTRSAVFTPMQNLSVIIVDEEHDLSYKQQDGFRYSARDVAVMRARILDIPIVLGSATPSLECIHNVKKGRYQHILLSKRVGVSKLPKIRLIDLRSQPMVGYFSSTLLNEMQKHLNLGEQVLVFLNRRGFAPAVLCHKCGWVIRCERCDANLVYYQREQRLRCHHCSSERKMDSVCQKCGSAELQFLGVGTESVEQTLGQHFPNVSQVRIDRDSTRRKGVLEEKLSAIQQGKCQILIGTQMLAKGHHFPNVTLVAVLTTDNGLFSTDFRATERMAQLITQVAGRAGRAEKLGQVLIQTHHPGHPLLQLLISEGYAKFADSVLQERRDAQLPPYSYIALVRAEATDKNAPLAFLGKAKELAKENCVTGIQYWGPVPSTMERRAGRYRAQLLLQAQKRRNLQQFLAGWLPAITSKKIARKVRWSLDVDPLEMY